ncbi:tumor suppressor candidate 2-like isoform X2 [Scylla paramamosain]|uniref:tumor suppressor candidate 2-like isoform X2 n=1 Tax=Scylla paramamosain TaxID=85552 RepID=UPI0030838FEE
MNLSKPNLALRWKTQVNSVLSRRAACHPPHPHQGRQGHGSMYLDEDGDVAHEFYEEVPPLRRGVKATMRQILTNLTPQGDVRLPFPCLHTDFPVVLYQDSQEDPRISQR